MTQLTGSSVQTACTRRKAIQLLSTAAGGSLLLTAAGCKHVTTNARLAASKADLDCSNNPSVFCQVCGPNKNPKTVYDDKGVYPYFALWLMLTTEEWDTCVNAAQWQAVQTDFGINPADFGRFDSLYNATHDPQPPPGGTISTPVKEMFAHMRWLWQDFCAKRLNKSSYYPGYGTLWQIAKLFPQTLSTSLPEQCGGGAAVITLPPLGPIAYWLMLITEKWYGCANADSTWNTRLAAELKMDPADLKYLFDMSQDKKPAVSPQGKPLPYSNNDVFQYALGVWDTALNGVLKTLYGKRPCAGGATILQIVAGGK